jgi:TPR repeat protein
MLRVILLAFALTLSAVPVAAGTWDDFNAAHERGDYETALRLIRPLAEQGYAAAQTNLGVMYANGQGVPQDYAEALKWYRKAAEQGNAGAQRNLGAMYSLGRGVPQDFVLAHEQRHLSDPI